MSSYEVSKVVDVQFSFTSEAWWMEVSGNALTSMCRQLSGLPDMHLTGVIGVGCSNYCRICKSSIGAAWLRSLHFLRRCHSESAELFSLQSVRFGPTKQEPDCRATRLRTAHIASTTTSPNVEHTMQMFPENYFKLCPSTLALTPSACA